MRYEPVVWLGCRQAVMITYEKTLNNPQIANRLIGMSLAEFDKLYAAFELAHRERESDLLYTRRHKRKRQRIAGAGRKHRYALRDRLLMTLFWLRARTTYEVLASIYDLDKTTVEDNLKDVLDVLARIATFHFELPQPEVSKLSSLQEVMAVFPDVRLLMDAKKQHLGGKDKDGRLRDRQRSHDSGKK